MRSAKASIGSYSLITSSTFGYRSARSATIGSRDTRTPVAKPTDADGARRLCVGIEVEARAVDGRQDGDRMVGQPLPAGVSRTRLPSGSISWVPVSFASAAICWDTVDSGQVKRLGDCTHGAQPRQGKEKLQSPGVHG